MLQADAEMVDGVFWGVSLLAERGRKGSKGGRLRLSGAVRLLLCYVMYYY